MESRARPAFYCFPIGAVRISLWVPHRESYERKERRLARNAGVNGAKNARYARTTGRLGHRAADRANQRRFAGRELWHALSGASEAAAGRLRLLRVGPLRSHSASNVLQADAIG